MVLYSTVPRSAKDLNATVFQGLTAFSFMPCCSFFFPSSTAMRRKAADAMLPHSGDQLPEDPRLSKSAPRPSKTRIILVHNLPIEGCDDGVTSLQFEVPADGIIDDVKRSISERLSNERVFLSRRVVQLHRNGVHQPYIKQLTSLDQLSELMFQWSE